MASVQGPQVVLESSGVSGCPITRELETFSILSVKNRNGTQKLMMLLGTPPLCKIFVPESFDKPRKRNHGNKQNPQCCFDGGHADTSAQSRAAFG